MDIPKKIMPGAEPFELSVAGTNKAALLIHGLTGSPSEMRYIGEVLNKAGYHVRAPLLPGHGTTIKDLNNTRWDDWFNAAELNFFGLSAHFEHIFIAGISMGGLVTLKLLEAKNGRVAGAAIVSTPMIFSDWKAKYLLPIGSIFGLHRLIGDVPKSIPDVAKKNGPTHVCYDRDSAIAAASLLKLLKQVKRNLNHINSPLLIIQSRLDQVVSSKSAHIIEQGISSKIKEILLLKKSYHTATVDVEKELVAGKILDFFERRLS